MLRLPTLILLVYLISACTMLSPRTMPGDEAPVGDEVETASGETMEPSADVQPAVAQPGAEPETAPEVTAGPADADAAPDPGETAATAPVTAPSTSADNAAAPAPESSREEQPVEARTGTPAGWSISGRVELSAPGEAVDASQYRDIVVYFESRAAVSPPEPGSYRIGTERKRFVPDVLVVPAGSRVSFPNDDNILHNVFSVSPNATFDLGRYGLGESRSYTFHETGLALIHCDVHHAMQADVLVVDTPFHTVAGADGSFTLSGIPAGPGILHIWHPRADAVTREMTLPLETPVNARLDLVKPRVAQHANKQGGSYRRERDDATTTAGQVETESAVAAGMETTADGSTTAGDSELAGKVTLLAEDESPTPEQLRDIVVYYQPEGAVPPPQPGRYRIGTRNKTFDPDLAVVPVGSTVDFPNNDAILHNVFSVSPNAVFDLGRYGQDESRSHTFDEPGLALIHCDVHHHMQADVMVVDTPYFTRAGEDGSFRLAGLPDGPGSLYVWHPRAAEIIQRVTLPAPAPVEVKLEINRPRVPKHLNKFGEPYRARSRPEEPDVY